jgi:hypothetical protein
MTSDRGISGLRIDSVLHEIVHQQDRPLPLTRGAVISGRGHRGAARCAGLSPAATRAPR